ncbi:MAG: hypothetical protein ACLU80_04985 [Dorea sp.]
MQSVVSMADHAKHEKNLGWEFVYDKDHIDPVLGIRVLKGKLITKQSDDHNTGRTTVPALIDTKTGKVVNNDYTWLTNYFEVDFVNRCPTKRVSTRIFIRKNSEKISMR